MHENFDVPEIEADRVRLRKAVPADLEQIVATQVDPDVRRYLGGPFSEEQVHARVANTGVAALTAAPGSFVVANRTSDQMLGTLSLIPRNLDLPGHVAPGERELELSYLLLRDAWGFGYAFEAAAALLTAAAGELPDQPVLIVTQSENARSLRLAARLGFRFVKTFEQFDATQSLLVAQLRTFLGT
jgi:RimJ/RimL family protein N-acetyltransferase